MARGQGWPSISARCAPPLHTRHGPHRPPGMLMERGRSDRGYVRGVYQVGCGGFIYSPFFYINFETQKISGLAWCNGMVGGRCGGMCGA